MRTAGPGTTAPHGHVDSPAENRPSFVPQWPHSTFVPMTAYPHPSAAPAPAPAPALAGRSSGLFLPLPPFPAPLDEPAGTGPAAPVCARKTAALHRPSSPTLKTVRAAPSPCASTRACAKSAVRHFWQL